jgi:hypothetical protein
MDPDAQSSDSFKSLNKKQATLRNHAYADRELTIFLSVSLTLPDKIFLILRLTRSPTALKESHRLFSNETALSMRAWWVVSAAISSSE